ncbi:MAG: glucose-1-phosphate thymidylyltransferase, partial [Candidatus Latescibacterota bacterium]
MKALILAAGRGEKFHPFSYYRPKPLFPIANRPLMEYTLRE